MILDRFRLDGSVAIVTGAGRGLGAAVARALAEAGADVLIAARTRSDLDAVAADVRAAGGRAATVDVDLSEADPADLVQHAVDSFGRLDVVVNNVGGALPKPLLDTTADEMNEAFAFNVGTAHRLTVAAVPHLLKQPGSSIVNISSAMGRLPGRAFAAYGTAKAALAHYTRLAAADLCPAIRVNAIAPGAILTSALELVASDEGLRHQLESATPLRRIGAPEDVAAAAVFLASRAGSYITGKVIEVDGGLVAPNLEIPLPDLAYSGGTEQ
ncbi:SDR family oxidoreductase [Tsukamurella sp. 1534]|uniref:SDR family oxidoreductase n=1 Tax=Tsukamurella sp. 1534 TaxID=1151061 RepID=UPI0003183DE7|nr:SDR family oxidoreductase [Tsukamurella sp. 1534]